MTFQTFQGEDLPDVPVQNEPQGLVARTLDVGN